MARYINIQLDVLNELLSYNHITGHIHWKVSVSKNKAGTLAGNLRNDGYIKVQINKKPFKAHRLAWAMYYGEWPDLDIDHIDGNRANNKISNLRLATRNENNRNRKAQTGSSKFKGVQWHKAANKWVARAYKDDVRVHLGVFNTEIEAATAYNKAVSEWYKEYAVLNKVGENN